MLALDKAAHQILDDPLYLAYILGYDRVKTEIHAQWINDVMRSTVSTAVMAHRGSYKTTCRCLIGVVGRMLFDPNKTILLLRKTKTEAQKTMEEVKIHWEQNEPLIAIYRHIYDKIPLRS